MKGKSFTAFYQKWLKANAVISVNKQALSKSVCKYVFWPNQYCSNKGLFAVTYPLTLDFIPKCINKVPDFTKWNAKKPYLEK